jgi:hypothetical protein
MEPDLQEYPTGLYEFLWNCLWARRQSRLSEGFNQGSDDHQQKCNVFVVSLQKPLLLNTWNARQDMLQAGRNQRKNIRDYLQELTSRSSKDNIEL